MAGASQVHSTDLGSIPVECKLASGRGEMERPNAEVNRGNFDALYSPRLHIWALIPGLEAQRHWLGCRQEVSQDRQVRERVRMAPCWLHS